MTKYNKNVATTYGVENNFLYKGEKNKSILPDFATICELEQKDLKEVLSKIFIGRYGADNVIVEDGFVYAKGTIPILLTAHMDTVHKTPVINFYECLYEGKHYLSSPQGIGGDDRCGIYMILEITRQYPCSVLFCEDEEIGCVGSKKFCKTEYIKELEYMKYLIELDRKGKNDAVFYDCDNNDFTEFITSNTGYIDAWGSCSDISQLAPACKVAAVNLSCGYYNAHTIREYVVIEEMLNTIKVVKELLEVECEQFEYIEKVHSFYGYGYDYRYDEYYGDGYSRLYVFKYKEEGVEKSEYLSAFNRNVALSRFMIKHPTLCYNDIISYKTWLESYYDKDEDDDAVETTIL